VPDLEGRKQVVMALLPSGCYHGSFSTLSSRLFSASRKAILLRKDFFPCQGTSSETSFTWEVFYRGVSYFSKAPGRVSYI